MKNLRPAIRLTLVSIMLLIGASVGLWWWQAPLSQTIGPAQQTVPTLQPSAPDSLDANHNQSLPAISPQMASAIQELDETARQSQTEIPLEGGGVELRNGYHSSTAAVIGADGKVYISHGDDFLTDINNSLDKPR